MQVRVLVRHPLPLNLQPHRFQNIKKKVYFLSYFFLIVISLSSYLDYSVSFNILRSFISQIISARREEKKGHFLDRIVLNTFLYMMVYFIGLLKISK